MGQAEADLLELPQARLRIALPGSGIHQGAGELLHLAFQARMALAQARHLSAVLPHLPHKPAVGLRGKPKAELHS